MYACSKSGCEVAGGALYCAAKKVFKQDALSLADVCITPFSRRGGIGLHDSVGRKQL